KEIVKDEVNVKDWFITAELPNMGYEQYVVSGVGTTSLATLVTPELKNEAMARDIIRQGQVLRREVNYALNDRIILVFSSDDAELTEAVASQKEMIMKALQADQIVSQGEEDKGEDVKIDGKAVHIGVQKVKS
ncbi:MAG: hypothetical protein HYZ62_00005, partial [Candidatus Andersenbacteria bacterium]|nr:hypothetical protein [Candidatus Andersenbacteria bacterium]